MDNFISVANVAEFNVQERLSKRLARMGICSRRMAEKIIASGIVKVDGKVIWENQLVDNRNLI